MQWNGLYSTVNSGDWTALLNFSDQYELVFKPVSMAGGAFGVNTDQTTSSRTRRPTRA